MAGLELDGEGDPGVALLGDPPEEDVGVEGAGGDVGGDNGGAHPCPALQQAYTHGTALIRPSLHRSPPMPFTLQCTGAFLDAPYSSLLISN